jgi:hypothetical protein
MAVTLEKYWQNCFAIGLKIDPDIAPDFNAAPPGQKHWVLGRSAKTHFIASLENEEKGSFAGSVVEANTFVAAEAIYNKKHRLATDEEILRELARREQMRQQIITQDNAQRNPGTTVVVTPEALRAALAAAGLTPKKEN